MEKYSTGTPKASLFDGTALFDPIEAGVRERVRRFIETMLEEELTTTLGRERSRRGGEAADGTDQGSACGPEEIASERDIAMVSVIANSWARSARSTSRCRGVGCPSPKVARRSGAVPRCARMTKQAEALIAATYLPGTNTRRVKRTLGALFKGAVGKDVVSRTWRKVKVD